MRTRRRARSAATLLLVVISLIVITLIYGAMLRRLAIGNRQIKQRARKSQATVLADSAIERAVFALRSDSDYRQETWKVSAEELGGRFAAQVEIEVTESKEDRDDDSNDAKTVSVKAVYPAESDFRVTVRKQVSIAPQ